MDLVYGVSKQVTREIWYIVPVNEIYTKRERERERDYHLRRSNMTYETKNITFHVIRVKVSSDSQCSRTLSRNVATESAHCGCERNSCKEREREREREREIVTQL